MAANVSGANRLPEYGAAGWVGQPTRGDDAAAGTLSQLDRPSLVPGPEVVNPGTESNADGSAQASTAYRAPASELAAADESAEETRDAGLGNGGAESGTLPDAVD